MAERTYVAIDLKSFYASSECVEHGFPPLSTHLVVADQSRTDKTICLAVSPSLKEYGLPGRARLFEVKAKLKEVNAARRAVAPGGVLTGKSYDAKALADNPNLAADVFIAKPRMSHYLAMSAKIYGIYLKYVSADDIHVYSVDEVFMDVTGYLRAYGKGVEEMRATLSMTFMLGLVSPLQRVLVRTCIWPRLPWTLWPSISMLGRMASALPGWTRCRIGNCCGGIVRLLILACWTRICEKARGSGLVDHGRYRTLLDGSRR